MSRVHPSSEAQPIVLASEQEATVDLDAVEESVLGLEEGSDGATRGNRKENEARRGQQLFRRLQTQTADSLQHHAKTYRQLQMEAVEDHGVPEHKVNGTDNKSEM